MFLKAKVMLFYKLPYSFFPITAGDFPYYSAIPSILYIFPSFSITKLPFTIRFDVRGLVVVVLIVSMPVGNTSAIEREVS